MPWFGQDIFIMADKKGPLTDKVYLKEQADLKRLAGKEGIDATLQKNKLDAIIAPNRWTFVEYRLGKRRSFFRG